MHELSISEAVLGTAIAMAGRALKALAARRDRFERDLRAGRERHAVADRVDDAGDFVARL